MRVVILLCAVTLVACESSTEPLDEPAPSSAVSPEASGEIEGDTTEYMPTRPAVDAMATEAEVLAEGTFAGASGHTASGRAVLIRLADSSLVVRLEGLEVDNGPDLRVQIDRNLVDNTYPPVDLGALKSTRGDQNYVVPENAALNVDATLGITIWCRAFSVGFGLAVLK